MPSNTPKAKAAAAPKTDKTAERAALAKHLAQARIDVHGVFTKLSELTISIPLKPVAGFKAYKQANHAIANGANPTPRRAAAIYIAALASGVKLADKATFPRKFKMRGAEYCLDNGAITRCTEAGLITYNSKTETVTIANAADISAQIKTTGFKL